MPKLKLGIIGIHQTSKTPHIKDLAQLANSTLNFNPLGKIITLKHVETMYTKPSQDYSQEEKQANTLQNKLDIIAIIKENVWIHYNKKTKLIYSTNNPINLAHEIGHWLGLVHPKFDCGQHCTKNYAKSKCDFSREIMGCAGALEETIGFSESDTDTIIKKYLT